MSANPPNNNSPLAGDSLAEDVLLHAQSGRDIIQDFVPLAESLEWELGQQYFRERGAKAFTSDAMPVPFVINNDGTLSRNAAEVLFASLAEADQAGALDEDIFVLEIGIGVGLFARFFLDHFQELCARHKKNYYARLCYVLADRSERMLLDALRHGVLGNHPGRYCVRTLDAMKPHEKLPHDVRFRNVKGKPFRAVFLNYLLDCLPAAVLEIDDGRVKELHVRTCVARTVKLADYTDLTVGQLQERAKSSDPRARQELLEVYGLFASEYDYRPVDIKKIPYGAFALDAARMLGKRMLLNFGAIQCLDHLLDLVHDQGFVLMNEYGHSRTNRDDDFEHQRFSYATAVGLNFPLLNAYFGESKKCQWLTPGGDDERGIHTRLMSKQPSYQTRVCFDKIFAKHAFDKLEEPIKKARGCVQYGRFELALDYYHQALKLQPRNWVLMGEISTFLTYQMRTPKAAIDEAKLALELNPTCSADLWNTLGDALFEAGRTTEAGGAYRKAMAVNESDVRSRWSLAFVHARDKDFAGALHCIADAFALDKMGQHRDRLLAKQADVLQHLALRNQQEYLLLINLVSKFADKDKKPTEAPPPTRPGPFDDDEPRPTNIL